MLGPLVVLHELGHYLVGRWFGVGAEAFSVGFGREIAGYTDSRGTRWKLSALPLGGYVQFKGDMNPASMPDPAAPKEDGAFQHAKLWQKALIVGAGPAANLLIAFLILFAFVMAFGKAVTPPVIESFAEESVAQEAGLLAGDRIVAIDGEPIDDFSDVQGLVAPYPGETIDIRVERNGLERSVPVQIASIDMVDRFGNESRLGMLGVYAAAGERVDVGPIEGLGEAGVEIVRITDMMVTGIGQIITGKRSVKELGGPITIAKLSGERLSLGWVEFAFFAALISLNLAFINLLPIPALDGGHLAFYAAEAIRGKPASARSQEWAMRAGIAVVLALMLFVTVIDIAKLPMFGS
ncbi:RIP metalloprotease RseP [Aurantiacibacter gangjinensis]|uniref:Zinc metalloprotease n=1 Tax=Aurantiacibacter gangjinensis TaxID=502682 RepID=A0A0G9MT16_9SPHN|nr:RIP metalloprotease RseP [Aurantiacibacter gangjinensis]KLE33659.1 peptidase [Aurantiacibacter gangjinensis]